MKKQHKVLAVDEYMQILAETGNSCGSSSNAWYVSIDIT
jgi:hypothetical protein